jgi:hypothetical protein
MAMNEEKKENQNDVDEGGVSVREIFGIIGKKIWAVLLGTIVVTLAAVLIFMFALNPAKQSKNMSFAIKYQFSSDLKYPDGSMFDYRDIVSEEVIAAAKENADYKEEFASLDVKKIVKAEAVEIFARQISEEPEVSYVYTLTLKSNFFSGVNETHFIKALTEAFVSKVIAAKAADLDYKLDEKVFSEASYKDQLAFLTEQKAIIVNQYGEWIKEYKEGYRVLGKSLGTHRTEVKTVFADKDRDHIENNLTMKGFEYFNGSVEGAEVKSRIKQLVTELKFVQAILEDFGNYNSGVAGYSGISPYVDENTGSSDSSGNTTVIVGGNSELISYIKRSQTIQQQIMYLTRQCTSLKGTPVKNITEDAVESVPLSEFDGIVNEIKIFNTELLEQFNLLNESAGTLTDVIHEIYSKDTLVTFESNKANSSGGTSVLIVGVAVFVIAFFVFAAIAYFLGRKSAITKKKANAVSASKEPLEKTDDSEKSE